MATRPPPQNDSLDAARGELVKLRDSADWDEPTGKTEVHVHVPQPSQPEIQPAEKPENRVIGVLNVALGFKQWPQVIALGILVVGALVAYWLKTR